MVKLHDIVCLIVYFCECFLVARSIPCRGRATYKLQFQAEWGNTSTSRPAGAKFSGFIGCSHNKCYRMWKPGHKASSAVKNVAEKGDRVELYDEIQQHIATWKTALNRIQTMNNTIGAEDHALFPESNNPKSGFEVDSSRPLVSVIVRVIPSSDWFIGVHNLNLCNESSGDWLSGTRLVSTLFPYDAGTARFSELNESVIEPTSPRQNIALLRGQEDSISDPVRGMGYMRFIFVEKSEGGSPPPVIDTDDCPNVASLRKLSSVLIWLAFIVTVLIMS